MLPCLLVTHAAMFIGDTCCNVYWSPMVQCLLVTHAAMVIGYW